MTHSAYFQTQPYLPNYGSYGINGSNSNNGFDYTQKEILYKHNNVAEIIDSINGNINNTLSLSNGNNKLYLKQIEINNKKMAGIDVNLDSIFYLLQNMNQLLVELNLNMHNKLSESKLDKRLRIIDNKLNILLKENKELKLDKLECDNYKIKHELTNISSFINKLDLKLDDKFTEFDDYMIGLDNRLIKTELKHIENHNQINVHLNKFKNIFKDTSRDINIVKGHGGPSLPPQQPQNQDKTENIAKFHDGSTSQPQQPQKKDINYLKDIDKIKQENAVVITPHYIIQNTNSQISVDMNKPRGSSESKPRKIQLQSTIDPNSTVESVCRQNKSNITNKINKQRVDAADNIFDQNKSVKFEIITKSKPSEMDSKSTLIESKSSGESLQTYVYYVDNAHITDKMKKTKKQSDDKALIELKNFFKNDYKNQNIKCKRSKINSKKYSERIKIESDCKLDITQLNQQKRRLNYCRIYWTEAKYK